MSRESNEMAKLSEVTYIKTMDADSLECVILDGSWPCVVRKNEFKVGDLVCYLTIDSFVPNSLCPFLTKPGKEPKEYNGIKGEKLKTVRLRKQLSQGLVLPLSTLLASGTTFKRGDFIGDILGIQKWEAPEGFVSGDAKGNFPLSVPKTNEERAQNLVCDIKEWFDQGLLFSCTEKVHGTSVSFIWNNGEFEVCSRNLSLKPDDDSTYWKQAIHYEIESKLKAIGRNIAIQGEIFGFKISGNQYGKTNQDLAVFNVFDIDKNQYMDHFEMMKFLAIMGLKNVPIISYAMLLPSSNVDELLAYAEGVSLLDGKSRREGVVFKCISDPSIHFKLVSNSWLLDGHDDR